jgi:HSP20 family protein
LKKVPKDKDESKEQYEERIKQLEKRIDDLEKKEPVKLSEPRIQVEKGSGGDINVEGLVDGIVGQFIPGLGGIIKALEKSSPEFRNRIADTDAEIKHKIDVGWSSKPVVDYHISTRPLSSAPRRRTAPREVNVRMPEKVPVREPIVDVLDGKDYITVIAELPGIIEEDLKVQLTGESLEINAGQFSKTVALPCTPKSIMEKTYKNGILQVKLERS